ncbi:D-3-phosphoglycerate dehydrogenase [Ameyamaea chiangmaiensis NBRC 103196]|nr:D-3-phosphoglycerate dehydrogenase [Ameyamaea chiangmaiensis NBRC 103196]
MQCPACDRILGAFVETQGHIMADTLIFWSKLDLPEPWEKALNASLPDLVFVREEDDFDPADVHYALVWAPPQGFFARFPNLRLIINLGAGVDAMAARDDLPPGVPVTRLHDPLMTRMMGSFVLHAALRIARDIPAFEAAQRRGEWHYIEPRPLETIRLGMMGLGELGLNAANECLRQGFTVRGWSRSPKTAPGIETFAGIEALPEFLSGCDILVMLLPKTPETIGLMSAERLAMLPEGAGFINVARGPIVDQDALVEALRTRRIGQAVLDVFVEEPLPAGDPLWSLDNVLITPHVASVALPGSAAPQIADNIVHLRKGEPVEGAVDLSRGY